MSSPFSPETKRGTEESLEAMERARTWIARIDTKNDAKNLSLGDVDAEIQAEIERVREEYIVKTVETAVDNYVFNHEDEIEAMLTGTLDTKVTQLNALSEYITEEFGRVKSPSFSKENLLWLVAQTLNERHTKPNSVYSDYPSVMELDFSSIGVPPERWDGEQFPRSSH